MGAREDHRRHTREKIADTAVALFLEHGYEEVTFDDVALAAGVSRSTVFRYFPEKEELPFARDVDHLGELQRLLRAAGPELADSDKLHGVIISFARYLETDDTLLTRAQLVRGVPRLYARLIAVRMAWEELVARDLAGGRRPDMERRIIASTVVGALFAAVGEWQADGGRLVPRVKRALGYTLAASR